MNVDVRSGSQEEHELNNTALGYKLLDLLYVYVTPPLAVAPLVHGDDMRWNPNDDGINFNP